MKHKIYLVEDHEMLRDCIRDLINIQPDMQVIGESSDAVMAEREMSNLIPDLAIIDVHLIGENGIELTKKLKKNIPSVKVLILSGDESPETVTNALLAGANGYIAKIETSEKLIVAIHFILSDEKYISHSLTMPLVQNYLDSINPITTPKLSTRETEVLTLLANGLSVTEISDKLDIGIKSVETYKYRVMHKLEISNIAELTKYAIREGFVKV